MRFIRIPFVAAMMVALFAVSGCHESGLTADPVAKAVQDVRVVTVRTDEKGTYRAPGSVAARERVVIASRVTAYLSQMSAVEGACVKKGTLLAQLDMTDVNAAIARAQAALNARRAAERDARVDFEKFKDLFTQGVVSDNELRKARLKYEATQSEQKAALAQLTAARAQLQYAEVRAPFDGTVVSLVKHVGDLVTPGAPIVLMESAGAPVFDTYVAESFAAGIAENDPVGIEIINGEARTIYKGFVERIVHSADPVTRSCLVKVGFAQRFVDVMPGNFGNAVFAAGNATRVLVPVSALTERGGLTGVFAVQDGVARFHWLRLGKTSGGYAEVLAGLEGVTAVVNEPRATLVEATPVKIVGE